AQMSDRVRAKIASSTSEPAPRSPATATPTRTVTRPAAAPLATSTAVRRCALNPSLPGAVPTLAPPARPPPARAPPAGARPGGVPPARPPPAGAGPVGISEVDGHEVAQRVGAVGVDLHADGAAVVGQRRAAGRRQHALV